MGDFLTKLRGRVIANKYSLIRKLGQGSFGAVYFARDVTTGEDVALKLEHRDQEPFLEEEYNRYVELKGICGFPQVYWYGWHDDFKIMAMELLGPSLDDLLAYCDGQFTLKTTLMLADQLLERLEVLHSRGLLHRDIKPANCILGPGRSDTTVYVTDFGLVQDYDTNGYDVEDDVMTDEKIKTPHLIGTARFASIRGQRGQVQSPYDDLEALSYMLLYFLRGRLPWQGLKATAQISKMRLILDRKIELDVAKVCAGLPSTFADFMRSARNAPRSEFPDHTALRAQFRKTAQLLDIEYDGIYDWTVRRYLEECKSMRNDLRVV